MCSDMFEAAILHQSVIIVFYYTSKPECTIPDDNLLHHKVLEPHCSGAHQAKAGYKRWPGFCSASTSYLWLWECELDCDACRIFFVCFFHKLCGCRPPRPMDEPSATVQNHEEILIGIWIHVPNIRPCCLHFWLRQKPYLTPLLLGLGSTSCRGRNVILMSHSHGYGHR